MAIVPEQRKERAMQIIKAGFRAFNGYAFTQADCDLYNRACLDPQTTENQRHKIFCMIIGLL